MISQSATLDKSPFVGKRSTLEGQVDSWFYRGVDSDAIDAWTTDELPNLEGTTIVVCTYKRADSLSRFLDSLQEQTSSPDYVVIVDASPDRQTESIVQDHHFADNLVHGLLYFHIDEQFRGSSLQRNFALFFVLTDLVAFFDDDVVLMPECLEHLSVVHRNHEGTVIGVGALIENEEQTPALIWRVRKMLRIVSNLQPGTYCRSGMAVPWQFMHEEDAPVEGDWLPGGTSMWKTTAAREAQFYDFQGLGGYAYGEDLDFSLRLRNCGKMFVTPFARLLHLHAGGGRTNNYVLGYRSIYNKFHIHRRGLPDRSWRDVAWFIYAYSADTLLMCRQVLFPRRILPTLVYVFGRTIATVDLMLERFVRRNNKREI